MYRYLYIGTLELSTYTLINALALLVAIVCNLFTHKQNKQLLSIYSHSRIKQKKYAFVLISICQFGLSTFSNGMLAKLTVGAGANYFGTALISPFLLVFILILMRINPLRQLDLLTPTYAITLVVFKIACFMHGCCEGKPTKFGLYYPYNHQYEFPSQLLEAFVALMIFLFLLHIARRPRRTPGIMFPLYLILYSATRFFTEFTRANEPVLWKLQPYHLYCLAGIVIGTLEWLVLAKCGTKLDAYFEQRLTNSQKSRK